MPTIGERLRAAREAKGLQIEDAHRQTKIHTKLLRAMEEDRTSEVLEPAYARGFLKKYAGFLGLDPASIIEEYRQRSPEVSAAPTTGGDGDGHPWAAASASSVPRWLIPAGVALIAAVGLAFLVVLAKDLYRTVSTAAPTPKSRDGSARQSEPSLAAAPAAAKPMVPKHQPLKLSVRAAQDCWMQIKADEQILFQNILGRGREETWTAKEGLELWVGNAAALTLTLNGQRLESLGSGVIKGIRVTRYGLELPKKSRAPQP